MLQFSATDTDDGIDDGTTQATPDQRHWLRRSVNFSALGHQRRLARGNGIGLVGAAEDKPR